MYPIVGIEFPLLDICVIVCRSIGTFARALLDGAKKPQISLRLGAAAASRDITLFHAMDTLHLNNYDITQATSCLVPRGPVLCADELEAWTQGMVFSEDFPSLLKYVCYSYIHVCMYSVLIVCQCFTNTRKDFYVMNNIFVIL